MKRVKDGSKIAASAKAINQGSILRSEYQVPATFEGQETLIGEYSIKQIGIIIVAIHTGSNNTSRQLNIVPLSYYLPKLTELISCIQKIELDFTDETKGDMGALAIFQVGRLYNQCIPINLWEQYVPIILTWEQSVPIIFM